MAATRGRTVDSNASRYPGISGVTIRLHHFTTRGAISLLIARSLIAAKCIEWDDNASSALLFSFDVAQWSLA